jgi:hypothetical protein
MVPTCINVYIHLYIHANFFFFGGGGGGGEEGEGMYIPKYRYVCLETQFTHPYRIEWVISPSTLCSKVEDFCLVPKSIGRYYVQICKLKAIKFLPS